MSAINKWEPSDTLISWYYRGIVCGLTFCHVLDSGSSGDKQNTKQRRSDSNTGRWVQKNSNVSLDSQDPRTSREPPGRPHVLRMDSSLEPWRICKLPRRPLLPHIQIKLRIKRIYKECLMLLRTRACSSELPWNPVPQNLPMTLPISSMCSESWRLPQIRVWSRILSTAVGILGEKLDATPLPPSLTTIAPRLITIHRWSRGSVFIIKQRKW